MGAGLFTHHSGTVELATGRTWTGNYTQTAGATLLGEDGARINGNANIAGTVGVGNDAAGTDAVGTFTIGGNLTMAAGSTLQVKTDGNTTDRIAVTGTANVGAINVDLQNLAGVEDIILSSNGLTYTNNSTSILFGGENFATAVAGTPFDGQVNVSVSRMGNNLLLTVKNDQGENFKQTWAGGNGNWDALFTLVDTFSKRFDQRIDIDGYYIAYTFVAPDFAKSVFGLATSNAQNAAVALDAIFGLGVDNDLLDALGNMPNMTAADKQALANALAQLHGEAFAAGQMTMVNMQRGFLNRPFGTVSTNSRKPRKSA